MTTRNLFFMLLTAISAMACEREIPALALNPWDPDTDLEFVVIDRVVDSTSLGGTFMYFHVDLSLVPPGHQFFWTRVYRNGVYRNTQPFASTNAAIIDANVSSGQTYAYNLDFIEGGGGITRTFGPFVHTVP